jgi:hypothetical protein
LEQKPEAELIRALIDKGYEALYGGGEQETTGHALLRLAEVGKQLQLSGPTDLSSRIDDLLYILTFCIKKYPFYLSKKLGRLILQMGFHEQRVLVAHRGFYDPYMQGHSTAAQGRPV